MGFSHHGVWRHSVNGYLGEGWCFTLPRVPHVTNSKGKKPGNFRDINHHICSKLQVQTQPNTQFPYERNSSSSLSFGTPKTMQKQNIAALRWPCSLSWTKLLSGWTISPTWNNPELLADQVVIKTPQHRSLALNCSSLWAWVPHMKRIAMDQHWELVAKNGISAISPMLHGLEYSTPFTVPYENKPSQAMVRKALTNPIPSICRLFMKHNVYIYIYIW